MEFMLVAVEAILSTIGSLLAASLLCVLLWGCFKALEHPDWAGPMLPILLLVAVLTGLPSSHFATMTMLLSAFAAIPLWIAGSHDRHRNQQLPDVIQSQGTAPTTYNPVARPPSAATSDMYPALSACIRENRSPTPREVHMVAVRHLHEGLSQPLGSRSQPASFATRRNAVRAAKAALNGAVTSRVA